MSVIVDDPALVVPPRPVGTTPRVYFRVEDGYVTYTLVATDRAHAEGLLRDSGSEWYDTDGNVCDFDAAANLLWKEISPDRAAEIKVFEDDGSSGPFPLNTFEPGDWFCSEY